MTCTICGSPACHCQTPLSTPIGPCGAAGCDCGYEIERLQKALQTHYEHLVFQKEQAVAEQRFCCAKTIQGLDELVKRDIGNDWIATAKSKVEIEKLQAENARLWEACQKFVAVCDSSPPLELMANISKACDQTRAALALARQHKTWKPLDSPPKKVDEAPAGVIMNKNLHISWFAARKIIAEALAERYGQMVSHDHLDFAAAVIARLANHEPPLLICTPDEMKD